MFENTGSCFGCLTLGGSLNGDWRFSVSEGICGLGRQPVAISRTSMVGSPVGSGSGVKISRLVGGDNEDL